MSSNPPDTTPQGSLDWLVRWLDDRVKLPLVGGIGLDAVVGLFAPVAGDALTGVGSIALLIAARRARVPRIVLARMLLNILVDVALGMVPVVGDAFDVVWRSNRRNLALLEANRGKGRGRAGDYAIVALGVLLAIASIAVPVIVLYFFGRNLAEWFNT